ncbi:aminotransferase class I/II-fold pyridoxal phosphate-dependent enzyme [Ignatzschineria sp. LJL83]
MTWNNRIKEAIDMQREKDRFRKRIVCGVTDTPVTIRVKDEKATEDTETIKVQEFLNFSSNDYLGLAHHPSMIAASIKGAQQYGVGSGGSPHVTGYSEPLAELEAKLADWLGYDRAIVYPSGFTANQAVIKLLMAREDVMIADRLSHASLLEAAMLSPARLYRFKHNDIESLQSYLDKPLPENAGRLVITEGIFSMDGDQAPLAEIAKVLKGNSSNDKDHENTLLMVDDAHGIGIIGEKGRGTCDSAGIHPDILIVTFGKAFGCSGAAVLLSRELAEYFVQFSKPLIYSTAIPPVQAVTLLEAINLIESLEGDERRKRLQENIHYFKAEMAKTLQGLEKNLQEAIANESSHHASLPSLPSLPYLLDSDSPIQPLVIGEDQMAMDISALLRAQGIWVSAIRPPTVPPNTARLRMTITAEHTTEMIDQLITALEKAMNHYYFDLAPKNLDLKDLEI